MSIVKTILFGDFPEPVSASRNVRIANVLPENEPKHVRERKAAAAARRKECQATRTPNNKGGVRLPDAKYQEKVVRVCEKLKRGFMEIGQLVEPDITVATVRGIIYALKARGRVDIRYVSDAKRGRYMECRLVK